MNNDSNTTFQCYYCFFTSQSSKEIAKHQRTIHPNYPPNIFKKESLNEDNDIKDNDGLSALFIDPVGAFGEVLDNTENINANTFNDNESQNEQTTVEHNVDDDEEDA